MDAGRHGLVGCGKGLVKHCGYVEVGVFTTCISYSSCVLP